ncbi:MAG: cysteine desulfurase [Planctomycetales bacterium]|nr:cysteine desulfurase [Planctomycetales bacterium]
MAPSVAEAMMDCLRQRLANPASSHRLGQQARRRLESARQAIAGAVNARLDLHPPDRVLLTSGATEANHLALRGMAALRPGAIVVSSIEHPSVRGCADQLAESGREVRVVRCDSRGVIDLGHLEELLAPPVAVVSLMLANNETGVVQPIGQAARLCRATSAPLHCDAVQGIGKLDVDFRQLDVDAMTFNAHKLHGPVGIGALVLRAGVQVAPLMRGGGQQLGTRPGTESVALAVGFAAALELWQQTPADHRRRLAVLRDELEACLATDADAVVVGGAAARVPHTLNVAFPGINRQELLLALDVAGIACSTGSACASGSSEPSPVLLAMGLAEPIVEGAIRLSLGLDTTEEEVRQAARQIVSVVARLRR